MNTGINAFDDNVKIIEALDRFGDSVCVLSPRHARARSDRLCVVKEQLEMEMLGLGTESESIRQERQAALVNAKSTGHWRRFLNGLYPDRVIALLAEEASLERENSFEFGQRRFLNSQRDILITEESSNLRRILEALHKNQKILNDRISDLEKLR